MDASYIFINGRIASGKDTQAEIIQQSTRASAIISPGNLYREALSGEGDGAMFSSLITPYIETINQGGLLPDTIIMEMLRTMVQLKEEEGSSMFLFTGFPRTMNQLDQVDLWIDEGQARSIFLCYAVLEQHAISRAEYRRTYATFPRPEDDPSVVRNRLDGYTTYTEPVLKRLLEEGRLDIIKSSGTVEEVALRTRFLFTEKYGIPFRTLEDETKPHYEVPKLSRL